MPTTSNFGWTTPADTDLVKDGAAAIRTLGNGIDTSLVDLKGGTTGQILSKNSNTDLDYTWINNDQGDITEVQAGTGISVASGTGPVPVVTNTVATTFDAKGDLVVGTGADTFAKLTVGANGSTLVADSGETTGLKWAPAGGKVLQVVQATYGTTTTSTSTAWADTNLTASITPSAATSKILIMVNQPCEIDRDSTYQSGGIRLLRGSTYIWGDEAASAPSSIVIQTSNQTKAALFHLATLIYLDSPNTTSSTTYKTQFACGVTTNSGLMRVQAGSNDSSIILIEIGA